ncbi:hypothetical protein CANCADRAFT_44858 [Tortispora caseinolytica NRRL Y-17796]|uniref:SAC domain-containing protein n=1 Tax=Tortispora caseinolytica NRRL Y-17796 TaxID=767744 RepID=A0A1E4THL3_9ASCO|nr:hypothetical protein CANCADRAFT_44858 [Tortispora caseinolytica NRRL Y-17796]
MEADNIDGFPLHGSVAPSLDILSSDSFMNSDAVPQNISLPPNPSKDTMVKFTIYETSKHWYIVASSSDESRFRCLAIDLLDTDYKLSIQENYIIYDTKSIGSYIDNVRKQNPDSFRKRISAWGLVGFIRFTERYYLCIITKRSGIAMLGGHYIYHIDATELIPVCYSPSYHAPDRKSEEARFLSSFHNLDLSRTFYFSYSYDVTSTLQSVLTKARSSDARHLHQSSVADFNDMYMWNHHLLEPFISCCTQPFVWCVPIIHGFVDQVNLGVYGKDIYITIIARRSRYFAGARFLKRGVNDAGYVANEVETEQIVADMLLSSFHDPRYGQFSSGRYTSFVQHRGSIPLFWNQDTSGMTPKPPIELTLVDPYFRSAALHFDDLFRRYHTPIIVLNLIKTKERNPRESILLEEFEQCIAYLNQFLPPEHRILYTSWDMSRASKSDGQEVISFLEEYAGRVLNSVGFFHNGGEKDQLQRGVCRTNCIDCLDRTNAAQFVIGKRALAFQLKALGVIRDADIPYDCDASNLLTEMFHDHGDTIALQYGGSHLVNTMETYRKLNQWSSHSRDLVESIKRFYSNSFVDAQRQEAINLFLGNYVWEKGKEMLWNMTTDYYLHHNNAVRISSSKRRSYRVWWTPRNLFTFPVELRFPAPITPLNNNDYYDEFYKPLTLTALHSEYASRMNSSVKYLNSSVGQTLLGLKGGLSPFVVRGGPHGDNSVLRLEGQMDPRIVAKTKEGKSRKQRHRFGQNIGIRSWSKLLPLHLGNHRASAAFDPIPDATGGKAIDGKYAEALPVTSSTLQSLTKTPSWAANPNVIRAVEQSLQPSLDSFELKEYENSY